MVVMASLGEETDGKPSPSDSSRPCTSWFTCVLPVEYRNELLQISKLAGPVVVSQLMGFLVSIISLVFCGHLGKLELAGVSLATAVINITGISIGTGLSSTCDTLISQTYGSGNLKRVGVILQRGILILLLACFPCWAVLVNTEPLLLAFKQSPEVARISQLYVTIFMPAVPACFMFQLQGKYLQNQGIMWPQVITGAIGNILNVIINYIFLYPLQLGVAGSAAANAISQYSLALLLFLYIWCRGLHKATWGGWSMDCLQEWGSFIRLAVYSILMVCLAWWLFEIGGFLAGLISEVELGAQSITYQINILAYMFPLGFSAAASVRVGNAVGAGNIQQAKLSGKVCIVCGFIMACLVGGSLLVARNVIGYMFTSDPEILQRVGDVIIPFVFTHVGDATGGVAAGVLRGVGKLLVGAVCNLVGFYFIGFPIGVSLMFAANMGVIGLWIGLAVCVALQALVYLSFLCKMDWNKATEEALVRAGVHDTEEIRRMDLEDTVSESVQFQGGRVEPCSEENDLDPGGHRGAGSTVVGHPLTASQLLLRRGLVFLIMILILSCGIISSQLLMKTLK
ncbi:multidrug and toxin extrusion protein 1-like [Gouania willdenowi]|uniref:Multidrug and toxin extrusion protein n=1 Tax=Gouania willdenowi TaxID=441366 RepID=A0A8C5HSI8_GOUWI|nr:multidrug and toxin extrusion protein 1-like [Gouania willdenowi]